MGEPEKPYEGYDCDWFLEEKVDTPPPEEINHLTPSGRHYQLEFLVGEPSGEKTPEKDKVKQKMEEIQEEDDEVLKQLKKTQAHISVWHLLVSS